MSETSWSNYGGVAGQGMSSMYQLIIVAALRNKQLTRGATPRITADPLRHRNTSIALEEVRRGLVSFTTSEPVEKSENDASLLL